jgi:hypothetical protein
MTGPQYLGSLLTKTHFWGNVSDIATPSLATATMELVGPDAVIIMDALKGDKGDPGQNADIVKLQFQDDFTLASQIPVNTLTSSEADIGKAWWIGNIVYVWSGSGLQAKAMGTAGPPGPVPNITPAIQLLDPNGSTPSSIVVQGDPANPTWLFKMKCPQGPQGENANISNAGDVDQTFPPELGQTLVWNGVKWQPEDVGTIFPQVYSIPEGAFTSFTGVATLQNIAHISLPPQTFPWTPLVFGHIRAYGLQASTDPLTLGSAAFLGNDGNLGGTLIARGFGNNSTFANIIPHYSLPTQSMTAVAPGAGTAVVPANHTGTQGDIYIDLWNEGTLGAYSFNNQDAQALIVVMPVGQSAQGHS